jgi:hypothetical protein
MDRRTFIKYAAAWSLSVGPARRLWAGVSGRIRGRVTTDGKALAGVRCSDGRRVVITDSQGRFAIDVAGDGGPFVFVVTPTGYWTDRFYVPTAHAVKNEVVFNLRPTGPADRYIAAYLTDIHLGAGDGDIAYQRMGATVDELNAMPDRPAFVLTGGDICLQNAQGQRYVELMSRLKMPLRTGLGNHELLVAEPDPRGRFGTLFGPSYHSFDCGHVHYVLLDGCRVHPERETYKNVWGEVRPRELAWLENDLKAVPDGRPTVVAVHIPLVSTYCERRSTKPSDAPWWIIQNADKVIDVLKQFNVPLVLQGHVHENERIRRGPIEFAATVAVSGSWWRATTGRELGLSNEPRGYRLIEVNGTRISHRYVASAESRTSDPGELMGLVDGQLVREHEIVVNFYDASDSATVVGRIDNGPSSRWVPATHSGTLKDLVAAHRWRFARDALAPGWHDVEVRCVDPPRLDTKVRTRVRVVERDASAETG